MTFFKDALWEYDVARAVSKMFVARGLETDSITFNLSYPAMCESSRYLPKEPT